MGVFMGVRKQVTMTRIGLIGCGMWGRNLARNLASLGALAAVADQDDDRATGFAEEFGTSAMPVGRLLGEADLDGVVKRRPRVVGDVRNHDG